jgi:hypothetical protein
MSKWFVVQWQGTKEKYCLLFPSNIDIDTPLFCAPWFKQHCIVTTLLDESETLLLGNSVTSRGLRRVGWHNVAKIIFEWSRWSSAWTSPAQMSRCRAVRQDITRQGLGKLSMASPPFTTPVYSSTGGGLHDLLRKVISWLRKLIKPMPN